MVFHSGFNIDEDFLGPEMAGNSRTAATILVSVGELVPISLALSEDTGHREGCGLGAPPLSSSFPAMGLLVIPPSYLILLSSLQPSPVIYLGRR